MITSYFRFRREAWRKASQILKDENSIYSIPAVSFSDRLTFTSFLLSRLCTFASMSWSSTDQRLYLLSLCFALVWVRAEENETVPYQSFCDPTLNNGECSDNFNCRCLSIAPTGERICILQMQCRFALPCNVTHQCTKPGTICVRDQRCAGEFFCYPTSFTNPDLCPPLATDDNMYKTDWVGKEKM